MGFVLPLGITDILRTIPATSPLSQVILEAHLYSKRETAAKSLKATEWLSIDRFLSNDNRPLQLVLKIHVVDDSGIADLSFLESLFEESMPNTHSRGLLRMEMSVHRTRLSEPTNDPTASKDIIATPQRATSSNSKPNR